MSVSESALQVECPHCGAPEGVPCGSLKDPAKEVSTHLLRVDAFVSILQAESLAWAVDEIYRGMAA